MGKMTREDVDVPSLRRFPGIGKKRERKKITETGGGKGEIWFRRSASRKTHYRQKKKTSATRRELGRGLFHSRGQVSMARETRKKGERKNPIKTC